MPKGAEAAASEAVANNARNHEHVAALRWHAVWRTDGATPLRWAGHRDSGRSDRVAPVTAPIRIRWSTTVCIQICLATWLSTKLRYRTSKRQSVRVFGRQSAMDCRDDVD